MNTHTENDKLIEAIERMDLRNIRRQLRKKHNLNQQTFIGETPLCVAAAHGDPRVLMTLIEHGADIEYTDKHGRTPVWHAATSFKPTMEVLLNLGANPNIEDTFDQTLIGVVVEKTPFARFFGFNAIGALSGLLKHGANPNMNNTHGWQPLHYLANCGDYGTTSLAIAKLLINFGANIKAMTRKKQTPLSIARAKINHTMAWFLQHKGALI